MPRDQTSKRLERIFKPVALRASGEINEVKTRVRRSAEKVTRRQQILIYWTFPLLFYRSRVARGDLKNEEYRFTEESEAVAPERFLAGQSLLPPTLGRCRAGVSVHFLSLIVSKSNGGNTNTALDKFALHRPASVEVTTVKLRARARIT